MRRESGTTLIEVLIAVTLLSLLSVGMLIAMRVGLRLSPRPTTNSWKIAAWPARSAWFKKNWRA